MLTDPRMGVGLANVIAPVSYTHLGAGYSCLFGLPFCPDEGIPDIDIVYRVFIPQALGFREEPCQRCV